MSMGNEQFQTEDEALFAEAPSSFDAPEGQQQAAEQQAPPQGQSAEPFEGFGALPEAIRQRWIEADKERQKQSEDLAAARRRESALLGKVPTLERELAAMRKNKPAQAAPASSSAAQVSAEAWEAFKAMYPDDAKAVEQRQAQFAAEIGGKLTPLEQQLKEQAEKIQRFEQMAQEAENESIVATLDEAVPDWKRIAGWENEDGSEGSREWHPEFLAWQESLPTRIRAQYEEALNSRDPDDIAFVINMFKRDYLLLLQEEESAAPQQHQQASPRAAALRDVMPSATGNSLGSTGRQQAMTAQEREWIEATSGDLMNKWRNAKTG